MEPITETSYTVNKNDFKYKKMRKLDINKIENKDLINMYYNTNFDTIEYRIEECLKEGGKILDLKYLDLKTFPTLSNELINKLEELYISNNEIDILPNLSKFKNLKILDVSVNKLKKINNLPPLLIEFCCFENDLEDINYVSECKELKILYIANNNISDLSFLNNNQSLEILLANFNNIEDIPRNIPNIRKIQIKHNKLKKIKSYPKLTYLDARNNKIVEIEEQSNLKDLIISYNEINELPIINTLKYLEIVYTNIEKIKYMKNLEELICLKDRVKYISSKYKLEKTISHESKYLNLFFIPE